MNFRLVICLIVFLIPLSASAAWEDTWDFRAAQVPGRWEVQGNAQATPGLEGVRISAPNGAQLLRDTAFTREYDVLEITTMSASDFELLFLWHEPGTPMDQVVQLPIAIPGSQVPHTTRIDLSFFDQWPGDPDRIGMRIPAGANVVLQTMRFRGWNVFEKTGSAMRSLFSLDQYRPYTINFLWGPQMTYNPIARAQLWDNAPPRSHSVNGVLYALLAIGCIAWLVRRRADPARAAAGLLTLSGIL